LDDGRNRVVIGSRTGDVRHPDWWLNLVAEPLTTIRIGSNAHRVRAPEALGPERDRLWRRFVEIQPAYHACALRAERRIPVVVLEPIGPIGA
jgi:F420H(2)-dependent quinone reductase